jgi:hypothetical protein
MLRERDYELIRVSFSKIPVKIPITQFQKDNIELKSQSYRKYTNAYYEEILIDYKIESRVA